MKSIAPPSLADAHQVSQFLEAVPVGVFVIRPDGTPYYANQRAIRLLGKGVDPNAEEGLGETYQAYRLGTDEVYPMGEMPIVQALGGQEARVEDMELRHEERNIPLQVWAHPVFDEEGGLKFAIAAFEDITRRKEDEQRIAEARAELERRNEAMRLVLDHVAQGFATVDREGRLAEERSAAFDRLLAPPQAGDRLWDVVSRCDAEAGAWLELGWESVQDGFLPLEVCLEQLPRRIAHDDRVLEFAYQPIGGAEASQFLVVVSDVTDEVARQRSEREQRELLHVIERVRADRQGFVEFFEEGGRIVEAVVAGEGDLAAQKRAVHTLKGNAGLFAVTTVAEACHEVENRAVEQGRFTADDRRALSAAWDAFAGRVATILGDRAVVEIHRDEVRAVAAEARDRGTPDLAERLLDWTREPMRDRLDRIAEQTRALARRLGKPDVEVRVAHDDSHLEPEAWRPFWGALAHVVRNAVDHGLPPEGGVVRLEARSTGAGFRVTVEDDGRGIDWERLRSKGQALGLPVASRDDLVAVMFRDGVSTRDDVTATSGRGVGMAAVKEATEALGGHVEVDSEPGRGTAVHFVFPAAQRAAA